MFDVANRESFEALPRWYGGKQYFHKRDYLENLELENACNISGLSLVLVGNKIDLEKERVMDEKEARTFAEEKSMVSQND